MVVAKAVLMELAVEEPINHIHQEVLRQVDQDEEHRRHIGVLGLLQSHNEQGRGDNEDDERLDREWASLERGCDPNSNNSLNNICHQPQIFWYLLCLIAS